MTEPTDRPELPGVVDARFTLAAERTVLAWMRTSLGLIAAGMAILHVLPSFSSAGVRDVVGIALIVMGALASAAGGLRWRQTTIALRNGAQMPGPVPIWLLIGMLMLLSVIVLGASIADP